MEIALHWLARLEISEHQRNGVETALHWLARLETFVVLSRPPYEYQNNSFADRLQPVPVSKHYTAAAAPSKNCTGLRMELK